MKGKIHSHIPRPYFFLLVALLNFMVGSHAGITRLGSLSTTSETAIRVAASGSYAYVSLAAGAIQIVDISDPANPVETGRVMIPWDGFGALSITVRGDYAYAATQLGLQIVNIADKTQPVLVKKVGPRCFSSDIVGNRLYVAGAELSVYDISDPANPSLLGSYTNPAVQNFLKVAVQNGLAYVGTDSNVVGMLILDVTDPNFISRIGSSGGIGLWDLQVKGRYVYAVGKSNSSYFAIYDVNNPVTPALVYSTTFEYPYGGSGLFSVAVDGGTAVISGHPPLSYVYDVSNPSAAHQTGAIHLSSTSSVGIGVASVGNNQFLAAAGQAGLRIFDIANPAAPSTVGSLPLGYAFASLAAVGDFLLVGDQIRGVDVVDISTPSNPKIVRSVAGSDGGNAFGGYLSAASNRLAMVSGSNLDIFDISNPALPVLLGSATNDTRFSNLKMAGSMVYTLDWFNGIRVFDVSDPAHISVKSTFAIPQSSIIDIIDHYLFVGGNGQSIRMLDISNPANIVSLGTFPYGQSFMAHNSLLYVPSESGLSIYGIANSSTLVLEGFFPFPTNSGVYNTAVGDGYAVVAKNSNGGQFELVDLLDIAHPSSDSSTAVESHQGMLTQGNRLFALKRGPNSSGLSIFQVALTHLSRPQLSIHLDAAGVVLRWPDSFADFKLYSSPSLAQPWELVISNPSREGSNLSYTNRFAVAPKLFYKLIK